jgi:hypothetical protein
MALLHEGLKWYAIYLVLISIYWGIFSRKRGVHWARHVRFLFAGLLVACVIMLSQKMGWYITGTSHVVNVGLVDDRNIFIRGLEVIEHFRQAALAERGRATYGIMLDTSSVLGLVKTVSLVFVYYMFAPFPWQVENVKDIYALLESMLRFVLLFFAVSSWRKSSGEARSYYGFLLIVVLGMEFVWAMGSTNYGTAIRHHVLGYSVIVLLGAPGLILFMRKLHFGMFGCRKVSRFQDREKFVKPDLTK